MAPDGPVVEATLPKLDIVTFEDEFVKKPRNKNIVDGIDYTVDFEIGSTPFVEYKNVPPQNIGDPIPDRRDTMVPKNPLKAGSDPILPSEISKTTPTVMSRADIPVVDMLGDGTKKIGNALVVYMKQLGEMIMSYTKNIASNDTVSQLFKDNSKIIMVLIAIAIGSFVVNAGISAVVVGIVLLIATQNVTKIF
jgi:hypothetical protein